MFLIFLIIGLIQGLTEFIPISSTAHMLLFFKLQTHGPDSAALSKIMAIIQMGTWIAVVVYFYQDIYKMLIALKKAIFKKRLNKEDRFNLKLIGFMIIGTIPMVIVAFLGRDFIEGNLIKGNTTIGIMLVAIAILLLIADRMHSKKELKSITIKDALIIGLFQILALIPGCSRSGITIAIGLFLGLKRDDSARFSFLLSLPAIFGAAIFEFLLGGGSIQGLEMEVLLATIVAMISGFFAIKFFINFLKKHTNLVFIIYRIVLAIILFNIKN